MSPIVARRYPYRMKVSRAAFTTFCCRSASVTPYTVDNCCPVVNTEDIWTHDVRLSEPSAADRAGDEVPMLSEVRAGRIVAALFIGTMLAGMVDAYYAMPRVNDPLPTAAGLHGTLLVGALSVMVMALGIFVVSAVLYPVVAGHSVTVALAYVGFRAVESVLLLVGAGCYLVVDVVARDVGTDAGRGAGTALLALDVKLVAYQIAMVVLGVGSLMLCTVFYRSGLLPRWLSVWGLAGYAMLALSAVLDIAGVVDSEGAGGLLYLPGGLWELVGLPAWLVVRGFGHTERAVPSAP
jgi:hypothetical protein